MKLRRRCKCGCGEITNPGSKWVNHHNLNLTGKDSYAYKHGLTKHKLFIVWTNMKKRCYKPNTTGYQHYGDRGIRVCIRWKGSFKSFYNWAMANGWQEGLEIDRKDNDGNYHPDNCRFVTRAVNNNNRRNPKKYKKRKDNTSGFTGVCFDKTRNKYMAYINVNCNRKYLGYFNTAEQAASAIENYTNDY